MNRSEKYDIKNVYDQFGQRVDVYFEDANETAAIDEVERIALANVGVSRPVMVELGSNQAYYSMLWAKILPTALSIMVEPHDPNRARGTEHFSLNKLVGVFYDRTIGTEWLGPADKMGTFPVKPVITLEEIMQENVVEQIHLLHSDIDGGESVMLTKNIEVFQRGRVLNIVLMTHGSENHNFCRNTLKECGYTLTIDSPDANVGWDGMIVAHKLPVK